MKRSFRWSLACLVLLFVGLPRPAPAQVRRVVLLYDERTDLPGLAVLDARLVQTLRAGLAGGVEVYREAMDLSRFQSDRYPLLLKDYLRAKYASKRIDVVIAALGPALDFMLAYGPEVYPGASIVFCGIDRRELGARRLPANVTGVLLHSSRRRSSWREAHPARKTWWSSREARTSTGLHDRRRNQAVRAGPGSSTWSRTVDRSPRHARAPSAADGSAVLTMFADGTGSHSSRTGCRAGRARPTRRSAFLDHIWATASSVGTCTASMPMARRPRARAAAPRRRADLGGPASRLPASIDMFDWRELRRWGIDERLLPADAVVRYRDISPWERYRTTVLAALGVLLLNRR
jgi:hypothetical protein